MDAREGCEACGSGNGRRISRACVAPAVFAVPVGGPAMSAVFVGSDLSRNPAHILGWISQLGA